MRGLRSGWRRTEGDPPRGYPVETSLCEASSHPLASVSLMDDTVTLALGGTVPLRGFAMALERLTGVLHQLSNEAGARVEWVVAGLDYSSAIATVAGRPLDELSEALVPRVVSQYGEAGEAVAYGRSTSVSSRSLQLLREIVQLIGDDVDEVRFETADREAVIRRGDVPIGAPRPIPIRDRGTVVGRVQTLQARGQLRFTVYDLAHDRAVSCYLRQGQEELMRGAWAHLVEVEGLVSRDPVTNVPLTVRQVTNVTIFEDPPPDAWLAARGAVRAPEAPAAEDVIRKLRDAW